MRTGILAVVALTVCGVALADPPPQQPVPAQVVEDINSLREELGESKSSPAEFFQAIQRMMSQVDSDQHQRQKASEARHNAQAWAHDGGYLLRPTDRNAPPPPHYGSSVVSPPPQFVGHHHPQPPRPAKALLVDTAFELERMAHELERAELYGEADSLRDTADRLRQSARAHKHSPREQKKSDGRPKTPPVFGAPPAEPRHPAEGDHAADRARRAVEEANHRVERLEREVAENKARFQRQIRQMIEVEGERQRERAFKEGEQMLRETKERRQRTERRPKDEKKPEEKRRRRTGADRPEIEIAPSEVNPDAPHPSYDLLAPPGAEKADLPPANGDDGPSNPQN